MSDKSKQDNSQDTTQDNVVNFETALEELESLVSKMESGDLSLDESLKAFERGVKLARQCQNELKNAELKVQALTDDGELVPLDSTSSNDDA
ncbi:MAG: exodeoxyribonuclease VII small subunit [Limisphaerales bacterium]